MPKIKILNIITDSNIGGAGIVLVNYYSSCDRQQFEHRCIVPSGSALTERIAKLGIETEEADGIAEKSLDMKSITTLRRAIETFSPDIVHTHASFSARIAAKRYGKCGIVTTRHSAYNQPKSRTSFPLKQILGTVNNHYSDHFIAVSPAAADNLTDTGADSKKISVIYNGVTPVRRLRGDEIADIKREYGIDPDAFVALMLARFVPEKGQIYAIETAKLLRDKNICFILAGGGETFDYCAAAVKSAKLTNVLLPGFISGTAPLHNIADIHLNCSYGTEATSLSVLEGYSLGKPAVVSDFGGNPFVVRDGITGLVVPQKDPPAIASAIERLYGNREYCKSLSEAAKSEYLSKYTSEIMARNIEKVYLSSIKKGTIYG